MKQPSRILGVVVAVLMVIGFAVFIATQTVRANLIDDGFYEEALASNNVYQRLYTDLLNDEEFAPQIDKLLGGIDVKREDVEATIKKIAPEEALQALAEAAIKGLIDYFQGDELVFSLDITPIVKAIHGVIVDYTLAEIAATPVKVYPSYQEFLAAARETLIGLSRGEIPGEIPKHSVPAADRAEAKRLLIQVGQLDPRNPAHTDAIAQLEKAVDADQIDVAIKWAVVGVLDPVIGQAVQALTNNALVRTEQGPDGPRFILSPPPAPVKKLETRLAIVQTAGSAASWARIAGLALLVVGALLMVVIFRSDKVRALRWVGAPLIVAGTLGFVAWLVARDLVTEKVEGVIAKNQGLPASLRGIMSDVAATVIDDLTPTVWIPSLALVGLGAALVAASFIMRR